MSQLTIKHYDPKTAPCSCCIKPRTEIKKIIAWVDKRGVDVYICDECVELCKAIIDQPDRPFDAGPAGVTLTLPR